jgi:hypothetical protein
VKLSNRTIADLAELICGGSGDAGGFEHKNFPYRSSYYLTEFFRNCDMDYVHDGTTRRQWVIDVLTELNSGPASNGQLPADGVVRVVQELMDVGNFTSAELDRDVALTALSTSLARDGLEAFPDAAGRVFLRNVGTNATTASLQLSKRTWSPSELERRTKIESYLDNISEDEFIEDVLVPIFSQLGFVRISVSGHTDKALEYGKDLWMKYHLPTGHYIYFGVQAKRTKLDAAANSKNGNVSEILNQVRMMLDHPIWDPETNKKCLLDHVYIACAREITKQARAWLGGHLDQESRRHIMFIDRDDLLNLALGVNLPALGDARRGVEAIGEELPF